MDFTLDDTEKEIHITSALPDDVMGIQEVFYTTWLATYPNKEHGITVDDLKYRYRNIFSEEVLEKRRKIIVEHTKNELLLVAKNSNKVVGVSFLEKDETKNELRAMYVLPEFQGQGIGTKFWNRAQDFFDQSKDSIVNVAVYNTSAIAFYKKLGFVDTGKRFSDERFRMKSGSIIPEMEMKISAQKSKNVLRGSTS